MLVSKNNLTLIRTLTLTVTKLLTLTLTVTVGTHCLP